MQRVSRCLVRVAVLVVAFTLVLPALTTVTMAQEDANVLRVHHLSYPDIVDPQKTRSPPRSTF